MTLFWHGHFANSESKVRDYRKMLLQNETFRRNATGNFRTLMVAVAQDPAMLYFLDAAVNVKGAPNENFAREIMELFTMGVGNYSERDIREAARAFTGWNSDDLTFIVNAEQHDETEKEFFGRRGAFNGTQVIEIILEQPVTADYLATKLYRYFVREPVSAEFSNVLGGVLRDANYELKPLLRTIFLSRDFYSPASVGTHIKSPVELLVSTHKKLGAPEIAGIPDFNETTTAMGQTLFWPPTVAGWAGGRSWITPGLLLERGNFGRDVMFPDIDFLPHDRYAPDPTIRDVHRKTKGRRRYHQRHGRGLCQRGYDDGGIEHGRRPRRGFQYPLRVVSRLADGDRTGQAVAARGDRGASRRHGARRRSGGRGGGGRLLPRPPAAGAAGCHRARYAGGVSRGRTRHR